MGHTPDEWAQQIGEDINTTVNGCFHVYCDVDLTQEEEKSMQMPDGVSAEAQSQTSCCQCYKDKAKIPVVLSGLGDSISNYHASESHLPATR